MAKNQIDITIKAFNLAKKELATLERQLGGVGKTGAETSKDMNKLGKAVAGIGFALLAKQAGTFMLEATKLAARVETLGVVTETLGRTAGYTGTEITGLERAIQKQGITTQASRQSLALMMQAQLDLADATDLARLAQDAAVIAGVNSSEAFQRLIYVITSGNVRMARTMGLQVNFNKGYQELAAQLGKTAIELTSEEKAQSRANTVMAEGVQIAGTYEAAMDSVGKQLESTARYVEEFHVAVGKANVGLLGTWNKFYQGSLKGMTDVLNARYLMNEAAERGIITNHEATTRFRNMLIGLEDGVDIFNEFTMVLDEYALRREFATEEDRMAAGMLESLAIWQEKSITKQEELDQAVKHSTGGWDAYSKKAIEKLAAIQYWQQIIEDDVITSAEVEGGKDLLAKVGMTAEEIAEFEESAGVFNSLLGDTENALELVNKTVKPTIEVVAKGDTITSIAEKYGQTVADILSMNPGIEPRMLSIGQEIVVRQIVSVYGDPSGLAGGGPLTGFNLVGEAGPELIVGNQVIPAGPTRRMMSAGLKPSGRFAAGGELGPMIDGWLDPDNIPAYLSGNLGGMKDGAAPVQVGPVKAAAQVTAAAAARVTLAQATAQASQVAAAQLAQGAELLDAVRGLATKDDLEQAMKTGMQQAMV